MRKIVVFESEKELADEIVKAFSDAGFSAVWFEFPPDDPAMAVAGINPEAITMDIVMHAMDGFRATFLIKQDQRTKNVPLVFYSNLSSPEYVNQGMALGAAAYVKKIQNTPNELVSEVKRILSTSPRAD